MEPRLVYDRVASRIPGERTDDDEGSAAMTGAREAERSRTAGHQAVVVDDSQFMRTVITDVLEAGGIEVVATAADGSEGVAAVTRHDPDVVTMDLKMPGMGGTEAVERIMAEQPTAILVLSAHAEGGDAGPTFEALERGAVDFYTKPRGEISVEMHRQQEQLVQKVRSVATVDPTPTPTGDDTGDAGGAGTTTERDYRDQPTLVIGASTGGPPVVEQVLSELPLAADLRVLVVQHMPDAFTGRFADRLDAASDYDVREASDGDRIGGGEALVAMGGRHMEVAGFGGGRLRVRLTEAEPLHSVRPAVDVTLRSAANHVEGPLTAAILTGMGRDGAAGVEAVADAGGTVVVQDQDTSAVFGMPKRAIETGVVTDVRPATELADGILATIATDQ
jgi:two-component system chemotaxis response regulator CheB